MIPVVVPESLPSVVPAALPDDGALLFWIACIDGFEGDVLTIDGVDITCEVVLGDLWLVCGSESVDTTPGLASDVMSCLEALVALRPDGHFTGVKMSGVAGWSYTLLVEGAVSCSAVGVTFEVASYPIGSPD
jgi:hypothetical protein